MAARLLVAAIALMPITSTLALPQSPVAAGTPPAAAASPAAPPDPVPSSDASLPIARPAQTIIAEALAAGRIDYPTSLLYRAYAMVDDPQLPAEYTGNAAAEDMLLFAEIEQAGDSLPADIRAGLIPYTVRPTDPRSIQSKALPSAGLSGGHGRLAAARPPLLGLADGALAAVRRPLLGLADGALSQGPDVPCHQPLVADASVNSWAARESPKGFKVWALCSGTFSADINRVYDLLDGVWGPETALMGNPVPDAGGNAAGGGDEIDVYLVDRWECLSRAHRCTDTNRAVRDSAGNVIRYESVLGLAISTAPYTGPAGAERASGYMLVARGMMASPGLEATIAHELFHILGSAHNHRGSYDGSPSTHDWLVESSAEWAGWYFTRERSHGHAFFEWYMALADFVDKDRNVLASTPLNIPSPAPDDHAYAAWVWHLFLQMEKGGPEAIAAEWRAIEGERGKRAWDRALDGVFPFATNLPDFAVRNLNRKLEPNDPLAPRYTTVDSGLTRGAWVPEQLDIAPMAEDSPVTIPVAISGLGSVYSHWSFTKDVRQVRLDPSDLFPADDLDVDALVKVRDHWERRKLGHDLTRFCRPGDDVSEMYLVLTNHGFIDHAFGTGPATEIKGDVKLTALDTPCSGINGTITGTYHQDYTDPDFPSHDVTDDRITLNVRFLPQDGGWVDAGSTFTREGDGHSTSGVTPCAAHRNVEDSSWTGSGTFTESTGMDAISVEVDDTTVYVWNYVTAAERRHSVAADKPTDAWDTEPCDPPVVSDSSGESGWAVVCGPNQEGVSAEISDDGTSADFACSYSETGPGNTPTSTVTSTWEVSGQLSIGP